MGVNCDSGGLQVRPDPRIYKVDITLKYFPIQSQTTVVFMRTKGLKIAFLTVVLIISIISLSAAAADDVKATNYPFFTKGNVSGGTSAPSPVDLLLGSITGTGDEQENLVLLDPDNAKTASGSWIKPIPVQFIRNAGQAGEGVRFEIVSETGSIFFTDS